MKLRGLKADEALADDGVGHRRHEERICARPDAHVLVGDVSGSGSKRVDDDKTTPTRLQSAQSRRHIGSRPQGSIRDHWVRAKDEHEVGAVDVGNRDRQTGPKHQPGGNLGRHLVDSARGEDVSSAECSNEGWCVQRR